MTGILRALDNKRRIIIPEQMLKAIGAEVGDFMELASGQDNEGREALFITKVQQCCCICGEEIFTGYFMKVSERERQVCIDCIKEIKTKGEEL